MGVFSEVKCARCDRRYSGLRSRCPYCGARRIGRGKYTGESDGSLGKMLIAVLILLVLVAAVIVLLVNTGGETDPEQDLDSTSPPPTDGLLPGDGDNETFESPPVVTYEPPDPIETETPEPVINIDSVIITYNGVKTEDFTMKVSDPSIPLGVKIAPADLNLEGKIEWSSSNTNVFEVVPTDTTGTKVKVTAIGSGTATLTVTVADVSAECIVRVR